MRMERRDIAIISAIIVAGVAIRLLPNILYYAWGNDYGIYYYLSEAVLKTMIMSKIRWFGVYLDNDFIHNVRADGIIIATPTGSTSYSLSVGGPILDPKVKGFIISYMAPFTLSARSMVVPSQSTIRVVTLDKGKSIMLTLDGQNGVEVGFHDEISFTESEYPAKFIRFNSDFYKNTREKMS